MRERMAYTQLSSPGGNHPKSVAVWTPEKNGDEGLDAARGVQSAFGGTLFVSETTPGYVVWFDATYTPAEIMSHEVTRNHSGILNLQEGAVVQMAQVQGAQELDVAAVKYLVCNENTLCYRVEGTPMLGVLASNIDGRDWKNGPFHAGQLDQLRPATAEDFNQFRVKLPPDQADTRPRRRPGR